MLALRLHSMRLYKAMRLYKVISKQENAHPEAVLLVTGDISVGNSNPFYLLCGVCWWQGSQAQENELGKNGAV
jgi:hypothetical protein